MDGDEEPDLFAQLMVAWLSTDWAGAESLLRLIREEHGETSADLWGELHVAKKLEAEGSLAEALSEYRALREFFDEVAAELTDDSDDDLELPDEWVAFALGVQVHECNLALQIESYSSEVERDQIEARLRDSRRKLWQHRQKDVVAKLEASEHWQAMNPFNMMLVRDTPLGPAMHDFIHVVRHAPELLGRPVALQRALFGILGSAMADIEDFEEEFVDPWLADPRNHRAFMLHYNADSSRFLLSKPRLRTLYRFFCASWSRGSSPSRHLSVREDHIVPGEEIMKVMRIASKCMREAEAASHPEEKIEPLAKAIHTIVELAYKGTLVALYRLEFDRDDLDRVPGHARQVGLQLRDRWRTRGHHDRLELIDTDALIIRNAVAHHHVEVLSDGRVRFDSISKGRTDSTAALTVEELEQRVTSLVDLVCDITNAFNHFLPPWNQGGLVRLRTWGRARDDGGSSRER